ncbi:hypothetical protein [Lysobacter gummosus]|uniref:hypothetical protein n=1 Tax=Lysobacter gummosus TaxID=262324 RepID=UPI00364285FE
MHRSDPRACWPTPINRPASPAEYRWMHLAKTRSARHGAPCPAVSRCAERHCVTHAT